MFAGGNSCTGALPGDVGLVGQRGLGKLWGWEVVRSTLQLHQTLLTALTHVPSPRVKSPPCRRHSTLTTIWLERQAEQPATLRLMPHPVSQQVLPLTGLMSQAGLVRSSEQCSCKGLACSMNSLMTRWKMLPL